MFARRPRSLRQAIARSLVAPLVFLAVSSGAYAVASANQEAPRPIEWGGIAEPAAPTKAETLVAKHDCWTGEAPADMVGQIPGHVVVTVGGRTQYAGEAMVGKALEQLFDGTPHGFTIHGFCR